MSIDDITNKTYKRLKAYLNSQLI